MFDYDSSGVPTQRAKVGVASEYPSLSDEALGALKLCWRRSNVVDDWTKGGQVSEAWDRWTGWPYMAKFTYDLTYAVRMLAKMAQDLPAWREVYVGAAERLCRRMTTYLAWYDWVEQKGLDPMRSNYPYLYYRHTMPPGMAGVYNAPGYAGNGVATTMDGLLQSLCVKDVAAANPTHPYLHRHSPPVGRTYDPDPIYGNGSSNMMYRGYFLEQLGHLKRISNDPKWDGPQQLVYDDEIRFSYTAEQIAAGIAEQLRTPLDPNGSSLRKGIDCEVGKVFPLCVSVGGLGLYLFDELHGTGYRAAHEEWFDSAKQSFIAGDPDDDGAFRWQSVYYDRDINHNMNAPETQFPLFFTSQAIQMAVYDQAYAERLYEGCIRYHGRLDDEGSLSIAMPEAIVGDEMVLPDVWGTVAAIACAQEFGDGERYGQLLQHFNKHFEPTYNDGEFYYTFGLSEPWPRGIPNHWCTLAHTGGVGDFVRMFREASDMRRFDEPTVAGVDFPAVTVRQAYYDREAKVLAVGICAGSQSASPGAPTSFTVQQCPGDCEVVIDGQPATDWTRGADGALQITTTIGDHSILIRRR